MLLIFAQRDKKTRPESLTIVTPYGGKGGGYFFYHYFAEDGSFIDELKAESGGSLIVTG